MTTAAQFFVLGPLAVLDDGGDPMTIPSGNLSTLLTLLLLRPNTVMSTNEICDWLWPVARSRDRRRLLYVNVTRLRKSLGGSEAIVTTGRGYKVDATADNLDLLRFRQLTAAAAHAVTIDEERRLLHRALALWRAPVGASLDADGVPRRDSAPLMEERLSALERRIELDLLVGDVERLPIELATLTTEFPLRERFWVQLITALYRQGRQAEALDAYRAIWRRLADDLGVRPAGELQDLQRRILRGDGIAPPRTSTR